ncbi:hypothetical protein HOP52_06055 [Halomonas campisalis]|uniref:Lysozyme family protein n=1 Tax=Billgrantia campisalis TaxID=74661 RepID=A0ABS9P6D6_9GAMM|nr:hypothetical protein [Halomonas campisalis]MCG6657335.1 hypothetical protein [Halomonas campisalis]MDR5864122.1 hypothetical protein [Halomonas campisalis]
MAIRLTDPLRREYERLFETCDILPERHAEVERTVDRLLSHRDRYQAVTERRGVPWYFVALVHSMESGSSFNSHLHNGDPLTARTVQVPAGRPKRGKPPFTWEESAADAMALKRLDGDTDWSLAGTLYQLERYNGWGYRMYHPHVLSPYLWSFSTHYTSGRYVADGRWSDTAVSRQCGAAVVLRRMVERGLVDLADQPAATLYAEVAAEPAGSKVRQGPMVSRHRMRRSRSDAETEKARRLQRWLTSFPGIFLKADGIPGDRTSDAYRLVTGHYLPGDPRGE